MRMFRFLRRKASGRTDSQDESGNDRNAPGANADALFIRRNSNNHKRNGSRSRRRRRSLSRAHRRTRSRGSNRRRRSRSRSQSRDNNSNAQGRQPSSQVDKPIPLLVSQETIAPGSNLIHPSGGSTYFSSQPSSASAVADATMAPSTDSTTSTPAGFLSSKLGSRLRWHPTWDRSRNHHDSRPKGFPDIRLVGLVPDHENPFAESANMINGLLSRVNFGQDGEGIRPSRPRSFTDILPPHPGNEVRAFLDPRPAPRPNRNNNNAYRHPHEFRNQTTGQDHQYHRSDQQPLRGRSDGNSAAARPSNSRTGWITRASASVGNLLSASSASVSGTGRPGTSPQGPLGQRMISTGSAEQRHNGGESEIPPVPPLPPFELEASPSRNQARDFFISSLPSQQQATPLTNRSISASGYSPHHLTPTPQRGGPRLPIPNEVVQYVSDHEGEDEGSIGSNGGGNDSDLDSSYDDGSIYGPPSRTPSLPADFSITNPRRREHESETAEASFQSPAQLSVSTPFSVRDGDENDVFGTPAGETHMWPVNALLETPAAEPQTEAPITVSPIVSSSLARPTNVGPIFPPPGWRDERDNSSDNYSLGLALSPSFISNLSARSDVEVLDERDGGQSHPMAATRSASSTGTVVFTDGAVATVLIALRGTARLIERTTGGEILFSGGGINGHESGGATADAIVEVSNVASEALSNNPAEDNAIVDSGNINLEDLSHVLSDNGTVIVRPTQEGGSMTDDEAEGVPDVATPSEANITRMSFSSIKYSPHTLLTPEQERMGGISLRGYSNLGFTISSGQNQVQSQAEMEADAGRGRREATETISASCKNSLAPASPSLEAERRRTRRERNCGIDPYCEADRNLDLLAPTESLVIHHRGRDRDEGMTGIRADGTSKAVSSHVGAHEGNTESAASPSVMTTEMRLKIPRMDSLPSTGNAGVSSAATAPAEIQNPLHDIPSGGRGQQLKPWTMSGSTHRQDDHLASASTAFSQSQSKAKYPSPRKNTERSFTEVAALFSPLKLLASASRSGDTSSDLRRSRSVAVLDSGRNIDKLDLPEIPGLPSLSSPPFNRNVNPNVKVNKSGGNVGRDRAATVSAVSGVATVNKDPVALGEAPDPALAPYSGGGRLPLSGRLVKPPGLNAQGEDGARVQNPSCFSRLPGSSGPRLGVSHQPPRTERERRRQIKYGKRTHQRLYGDEWGTSDDDDLLMDEEDERRTEEEKQKRKESELQVAEDRIAAESANQPGVQASSEEGKEGGARELVRADVSNSAREPEGSNHDEGADSFGEEPLLTYKDFLAAEASHNDARDTGFAADGSSSLAHTTLSNPASFPSSYSNQSNLTSKHLRGLRPISPSRLAPSLLPSEPMEEPVHLLRLTHWAMGGSMYGPRVREGHRNVVGVRPELLRDHGTVQLPPPPPPGLGYRSPRQTSPVRPSTSPVRPSRIPVASAGGTSRSSANSNPTPTPTSGRQGETAPREPRESGHIHGLGQTRLVGQSSTNLTSSRGFHRAPSPTHLTPAPLVPPAPSRPPPAPPQSLHASSRLLANRPSFKTVSSARLVDSTDAVVALPQPMLPPGSPWAPELDLQSGLASDFASASDSAPNALPPPIPPRAPGHVGPFTSAAASRHAASSELRRIPHSATSANLLAGLSSGTRDDGSEGEDGSDSGSSQLSIPPIPPIPAAFASSVVSPSTVVARGTFISGGTSAAAYVAPSASSVPSASVPPSLSSGSSSSVATPSVHSTDTPTGENPLEVTPKTALRNGPWPPLKPPNPLKLHPSGPAVGSSTAVSAGSASDRAAVSGTSHFLSTNTGPSSASTAGRARGMSGSGPSGLRGTESRFGASTSRLVPARMDLDFRTGRAGDERRNRDKGKDNQDDRDKGKEKGKERGKEKDKGKRRLHHGFFSSTFSALGRHAFGSASSSVLVAPPPPAPAAVPMPIPTRSFSQITGLAGSSVSFGASGAGAGAGSYRSHGGAVSGREDGDAGSSSMTGRLRRGMSTPSLRKMPSSKKSGPENDSGRRERRRDGW